MPDVLAYCLLTKLKLRYKTVSKSVCFIISGLTLGSEFCSVLWEAALVKKKKKKKVTLFEVRSLGVHSDPGLSSSSY